MLILASLLLAIVPLDAVAVDEVDVIEISHFCDDRGREVFVQQIFWEWNDGKSRHQVVDWRMLKNESQRPRRVDNTFVCRWFDTQKDCWRKVIAKSFHENWSQADHELVDRERFPKDQRRGLTTQVRTREPVIAGGEIGRR